MRYLTLLAVLLVTVSAACGKDDSSAVDFTDPGTRYAVAVGDEFTVVLDSNATTGFTWDLEAELPIGVLDLVGNVYVAPETDLVGAGGSQELTFRAVGDGSTFIRLWYIRSFDDPPEPADRAQFEVIVGSGGPDGAADSADVDEPVGPTPDDEDAIDLADLIATAPTDEVVVRTLLFDDGSGLVMCEVLAESFPPQCMGPTVPITNPAAVDAVFTELGAMRWSDRVEVLTGTYAAGSFTVTGA